VQCTNTRRKLSEEKIGSMRKEKGHGVRDRTRILPIERNTATTEEKRRKGKNLSD